MTSPDASEAAHLTPAQDRAKRVGPLRRRERSSIYGDILHAIEKQREAGGSQVRVTKVAFAVNVPYDRLVTYLVELNAAGLVVREPAPTLTPEGEAFLRQWLAWKAMLGRFGLD